jgi:hypothetical protein
MNKHILYITIFSTIFFQACDFKDQKLEYEETLVIFANITANFPVTDTVLVSRTASIDEDVLSDNLWVENAEVVLIDSLGVKLPFQSLGNGRYFPISEESSIEQVSSYLDFIIRGGEKYSLLVKTESDSVIAETFVPTSINIEPLEAMEYECPDGEMLNTKKIDVNNLGNISFSDMATLISDPNLYVQSNDIMVDTVNYRFGDCFTQSFASYPYFTVEFESENYKTIKILTYALDAKKRGLEPLDSLSNTEDPDSGGFFDYNYNQIRDSTFVNLIYDTTLGFRIWKGQYPRNENSVPYRINPWQWNIEESPQPIMWLYFDYYGLQLMTFQATSESYFNYFSGDPVGQNIYLLPDSNFEGAKGVFYSSASTSFLVYVKRDN